MSPDTANSKPPSMVPGVALLGLGAVLIVILLIKPDMPGWAKLTIGLVTLALVIALLIWATVLFRVASGKGRKK